MLHKALLQDSSGRGNIGNGPYILCLSARRVKNGAYYLVADYVIRNTNDNIRFKRRFFSREPGTSLFGNVRKIAG
jgi:hypothetical protein